MADASVIVTCFTMRRSLVELDRFIAFARALPDPANTY